MEKIDMSLDDIIKLQRKERKKLKAASTKKVTLPTKPYKPVRGRKAGQSGVSPLNRSSGIQPTSVINGRPAYSARYLKPQRGRKYQGKGKNQQTNRPITLQQRLRQKRQNTYDTVNRFRSSQAFTRFNQRKRAATASSTVQRSQQTPQKFNQRRRVTGQAAKSKQKQTRQQRFNQKHQLYGQTTLNKQRTARQQRFNQRQQRATGTQAKKIRQIQQPRRQQQNGGPAVKKTAILRVSISTNTTTKNGPIKLKRNTFYSNNTSNRPANARVKQGGRRKPQPPAKAKIPERTVIF